MKDDVRAIPSNACNVVANATTIYSYRNNVRDTYTQIGGRWFKTASQSYTSLPNNYVCVDVSELNSNAVYEPIFYFISFFLFIVCVWLFFLTVRRLIYGVKIGS